MSLKNPNSKRKQAIITITLIALLTTSIFMATISTAAAYDRPTYAFISAAPSPIGVGRNSHNSHVA